MALVMRFVAPVKAEIRLQQAVQGIIDDLKPEQRDSFFEERETFRTRQPDENDVAAFVGKLNRQTSRSHRYGPRFFNMLQVAQRFAAIGDVLVGGSQNLVACGVWVAMRTTLLLIVTFNTKMEKFSRMFMVAGHSAPRYEAICRRYSRKPKRLWSFYHEYFVVLIDDGVVDTLASNLAHWASMIREETTLLMAQSVEEQGSILGGLMDISVLGTRRKQGAANARVLTSCSRYDYQADWKRIRKMGTTTSFLETSEYISWKGHPEFDRPRTLLYTGKLGCGKSVLMANIVEDLTLHVEGFKVPVAYFFCQYDDHGTLKASTIIGCLARQLLQSIPDLSQAANAGSDHLNLSQTDDIIQFLSLSLPPDGNSYLVVDGLDECSVSQRQMVISGLHQLQRKFALRVCVSFRQEANNALCLHQMGFIGCSTVTILDKSPEIEQFIFDELERCIAADLLAVGDPTLIVEIVTTLTEHAHGMFLWVALQISALCASETDIQIRQSLANLPKSLAETFARILDKSAPSSKGYQQRILELVICAFRLLTVEEFREALGVVPGNTDWDPARLPNNIYSVLQSCGALLILDEETLQIRLVHQTLTYLNYGIFDTQLARKPAPQKAAGLHVVPVTVIQSTSSSNVVKNLALKVLRSSKASAPNSDLNRLLQDVRERATISGEAPEVYNLLDQSLRQGRATNNEDDAMLQLLLQAGASITLLDEPVFETLRRAAEEGQTPVVKFLVRGGATPAGFIEGTRYGALSHAAANGHLDVVEFLVHEHDNWAAVVEAAANGHLDVVEFLVAKGARLENTDFVVALISYGTLSILLRQSAAFAERGLAVVHDEHPESSLTRKDIYNARARINRDKLNGYSPTAALVKLFDEMKLPYFVRWADDEPNRLVGLVWTFPYCLQMWKRFPEVVSFDNTYNTNRFKLPLFQATGQTCLGSVYNAAFGLIDNERREGFQFLSESMRQLSEQRSIRQPDVIITDFDNQMKAALDDQFPDAQQQLCIHHINSNVLLKSKQKWVENDSGSGSSDEEDLVPVVLPHLNLQDEELVHTATTGTIPHSYRGVLMMWKLVVFAETEEAHEKAWKNLYTEFDDQRAILRYLHGTYMTTRAQWARCFIRKYRNFGVRVTSGTEASNNNIKSYLLNGMSNLYRLIEAMQDMMKDQERDFNDACAADEVLTSREYTGPSSEFLGELRTVLSSKGLALIMKQYRLAKKALPTRKNPFPDRLEGCSDDCSVSIELDLRTLHKLFRLD
ncbi:hypothetical protein O9K51_08416 [Purpureocillium lavendulum]|uniref:Uncharacterized protein n=1 Tax=Purpureocillium lavendulum TaxID=1247861 RepID=A0AB34FIU0_9HYPO|nr:hypothetical protein O9K51_08416 [Purpureocillium lavendulum]